jgi:hypothetical protein
MTNDTAISAIAAMLPTTGAATHAMDGGASPAAAASADEGAGAVSLLGLGNMKGKESTGREDEEGVLARSPVSVVGGGSVGAEGSGDAAGGIVPPLLLLLPAGGVKKMTPPLPAGGVDTSGMVDTPGLAGAGVAAGSGTAAAAATMAESVRRSAATSPGLARVVLR